MLHMLLARYGLTDESVLCIDSKPSTLKSGQADGIQPRTLEVFKTLGISDEIENGACQMWEFAFWSTSDDPCKIIERRSCVPEVIPPARFQYEATIHQGRVERIMETDLLRYSARVVERESKLVSMWVDEGADAQFPVCLRRLRLMGLCGKSARSTWLARTGRTRSCEGRWGCSWRASP